jgi:RES domain-containing protein
MTKLYRISACKYLEGKPGEGAFLAGGRWNSKGTRLVYASESSSLSLLEALAHITMLHLQQKYCMQIFEIPDSIIEVQASALQEGWQQNPPPDFLKHTGDEFVKNNEALALKVPSVIVPEGYNYLVNPAHPFFAAIKQVAVTNITFDQRLIQNVISTPKKS